MKKLVLLFLAFLLPGLIFVMLKYTGKNEFNIPVYYEKGVDNVPGECNAKYATPYILPDSVWRLDGLKPQHANVIIFAAEGLNYKKLKSELESEFGAGSVGLLGQEEFVMNADKIRSWKTCIFLVKDPLNSVLFDKEGKIRGYYDPRNLDELDRLRVEIKILIKKY